MVEAHWEDLRGDEVRHGQGRWELTGNVEVRRTGELLGVEARELGDVRRRSATLYFDVSGSGSLNPGNLDDHAYTLERREDGQYLLVQRTGRTYRYQLQRLEPD